MRGDAHVRFGGRAEETGRRKRQHRASARPYYYALEGLFEELWLRNAQHVKNVPGRKSDLSDAEWLRVAPGDPRAA